MPNISRTGDSESRDFALVTDNPLVHLWGVLLGFNNMGKLMQLYKQPNIRVKRNNECDNH